MTDRDLILAFVRSLDLCDHMGDVGNEVEDLFVKMGIDIKSTEWEDFSALSEILDRRGIPYLYEIKRTKAVVVELNGPWATDGPKVRLRSDDVYHSLHRGGTTHLVREQVL